MVLLVLLIQNQQILKGRAQENHLRTKIGIEIQIQRKLTQRVISIILLGLTPQILIYFSSTTHNKLPRKPFPTCFTPRMGQIENG